MDVKSVAVGALAGVAVGVAISRLLASQEAPKVPAKSAPAPPAPAEHSDAAPEGGASEGKGKVLPWCVGVQGCP